VGATDRLFESVESAAASLGMPLDGPAYGAGEVRGVLRYERGAHAVSCWACGGMSMPAMRHARTTLRTWCMIAPGASRCHVQ
jgi:hypothetical protein